METPNQSPELVEAVNRLEKSVNEIKDVLIGTTSDDKPGILERLRRLEAWQESEKKFAWIISGIIIGDVVMRLWGLITAVQK